MDISSISFSKFTLLISLLNLLSFFCISSTAQQIYVDNKQNDCYNNNTLPFTNGFQCNNPNRSTCTSYLVFRSQPPYDSATTIGYLLGSEPSQIARINNITDIDKIPLNNLVIVPVTCSCSGKYYQHTTFYTMKYTGETYFFTANNTFQGLTTCQALMAQNPQHDSRKLTARMNLTVPLRCACPTKNQTDAGFNFLLSYLINWGEDISSIADTFDNGVTEESINEANELSAEDTIFPFTTLLVPFKTEPRIKQKSPGSLPPAAPPAPADEPVTDNKPSPMKWVGIGIGAGLFLLLLTGFLVWFLLCRRRRRSRYHSEPVAVSEVKNVLVMGGKDSDEYDSKKQAGSYGNNYSYTSVSSEGARYSMDSLILYKFEELQKATGFFREENRIQGSVYRGVINGDDAAIKKTKGDVTYEINILKQLNHSNVIRLSGFCKHDGNTYLVYEFVENGSLSNWLHNKHNLGWKQRAQIACQIADGLNYLHNDANPSYIHKDLKSSNILLDSNWRAKIANFGVARSLAQTNIQEEEDVEAGGMQLTRHVVGTKGYMAPEYLESGVITPKMDVFAFGVIILELLSGKEAATMSTLDNGKMGGDELLSESVKVVLEGENVREKLVGFIDPSLKKEYPLDLAFSMAQLAMECVSPDMNARPSMLKVFTQLSKILSSSLDWDPSV
ncbi:hypothetical protein MKW98_000419 [Papaver atlanticum]|uniref:Uncharacterized protein n=1 Tax=Papaver atlanticum TaxID=357466 RepID=A0AAD4S3X5_9MAGN|nr:hypothetical protein MKW98_000419 [Papaver atlanticum]